MLPAGFAAAPVLQVRRRIGRGAKSYEELDCWRLSADLRDRILTRSEPWRSRDQRFCVQIRDAPCSAPRNLAEGFGFYKPRVFARHARIARSSLLEVQNHLDDALKRKLLTKKERDDLLTLTRRALGATTGLLRYLDSCKGEPPRDWDQHPRRKAENRTKPQNHPKDVEPEP